MKRPFSFPSILLALALLGAACSGGVPPVASRTATLTSVENDVQARPSAQTDFSPASIGLQLAAGGEIKTGEASRAKLEIQPDETAVYLGSNTLFALADFPGASGNLFTRLRLAAGQIWIVLGGGSLEVETPAGVAAVRGSLMSVNLSASELTITCLEGNCNFTSGAGSWDMTGGDACDVSPDGAAQVRPMTAQEVQQWHDNVPESQNVAPPPAAAAETPAPTAAATAAQPTAPALGAYGPELQDFPPGVNPLTGLPADDPALLDLPAVLISITNFPASARPQAGLSYAPWIWEIYIGEGMTRFLVTFYGEEPRVETPLRGGCEVRSAPFVSAGGPVVGNLAWLDRNGNGVQEAREPGIGGVCVTLYDAAGNILQTTSTDSNGYYGFEVEAGKTYFLGFEQPNGLDFTLRDVDFDDADSDADPRTGLTIPITVSASDLTWDAGYIAKPVTPTPTSTTVPGQPPPTPVGVVPPPLLPPPQVGPIRSMRTAYENIRAFFPGGCLVAASGYAGVLAQVKGCKMVYGSDENDINSAMLDVTKIRDLAEANKDPLHPTNYSGNVFDPASPAGGQPASQLTVYYSYLNQARWDYDPLAGAYARSGNLPDSPETFAPESDRLTGRQLLFENIIIMIVEHSARAETWIDLLLQPGAMGRAYLFRDGRMYPIYWSTIAGEYEKTTQRTRPVKFVDANRNPFPLKPGHTWVSIFTPASGVSEKSPGVWLGRFIAPKTP